jgi:hypothetical protein
MMLVSVITNGKGLAWARELRSFALAYVDRGGEGGGAFFLARARARAEARSAEPSATARRASTAFGERHQRSMALHRRTQLRSPPRARTECSSDMIWRVPARPRSRQPPSAWRSHRKIELRASGSKPRTAAHDEGESVDRARTASAGTRGHTRTNRVLDGSNHASTRRPGLWERAGSPVHSCWE